MMRYRTVSFSYFPDVGKRMRTGCVAYRTRLSTTATPSDHKHRRQQQLLPSHYPVVIVGGGPSGLLLSNLLSYNYNVPTVVLDAQSVAERFQHPQAHFLNTRTMEILRHWLPAVYERVREEMPPVAHWNSFRFVSSMSQSNPLAQVEHPVDRPLQANRDSNGVLLEDVPSDKDTLNRHRADLSATSVGHLAQHTFSRILYDHAMDLGNNSLSCKPEIFYGTKVTSVDASTHDNGGVVVETRSGQRISADLVVAADGANSSIRRSLNIERKGKEAVQHLINIHVSLPKHQAERLHFGLEGERKNHAMLYSVFSPHVVAMVVCHSVGEYIIQIPYFPPYQSLQDDFAGDKLDTILGAIFGPAVETWELHSVRSWTMSSLIADHYYDNVGIALVGDAAHVFPPAGGFGMNTGIQDVHNLAWKTACAFHNGRLGDPNVRTSILQSYHDERRPIAQANAALSVRNYNRLLRVTKSLYLDEQHPTILQATLDRSPLPFAARQAIFRSLLHTALYPFSWIDEPNSAYARHVKGNLRRILQTGAGLPLLFPKFELDFAYSNEARGKIGVEGGEDAKESRSDTWAHTPSLKVGGLLPHAEMLVVSGASRFPNLLLAQQTETTEPTLTTTCDLPAQLSRSSQPTFVLLAIGLGSDQVGLANRIAVSISEKLSAPVETAFVVPASNVFSEVDGLVLSHYEGTGCFSFFLEDRPDPYLVLLRPDGHISSLQSGPVEEEAAVQILCDPITTILQF